MAYLAYFFITIARTALIAFFIPLLQFEVGYGQKKLPIADRKRDIPTQQSIPRVQVEWVIEATGEAPELSDLLPLSIPALQFVDDDNYNPAELILRDSTQLNSYVPLPPEAYQQIFKYP